MRIVDLIHAGKNNEDLLDKLKLKDGRWIWCLGSIAPYDVEHDGGLYCQEKRCRNHSV